MSLSNWFQNWSERSVRNLAQRTSRRSFLTRVGTILVGASAFPLLPVARASNDSKRMPPYDNEIEGAKGDPTSCDYWRYCGIDGNACACCGGSVSSCPPGTELSTVAWIGTCLNPVDGRNYIISYNDCCGTANCGRCFCTRNEDDKPVYLPPKSNDITWCFGTRTNVYNCTMAAVIGVSEK